MNQLNLELVFTITFVVVAVISLVMSLVLIVGVSKFGKRKPAYFQLGQFLLVVSVLCVVGLVVLYFFYPSYIMGLIRQTFRIGG